MTATQDVVSQRRRSFGFFTRPTILQELANVSPTSLSAEFQAAPKARPKSLIFSSIGEGGFVQEIPGALSMSSVPSPRQRVLTKTPRPRSVFGSFKSRESHFTESLRSSSTDSSREGLDLSGTPISKIILHSGEALTTWGLLRRKTEFLVLTARELLRFKNQQKAFEQLGIPLNPSPSPGTRSASFSSVSDVQSNDNCITPLTHIIAVYKPELDPTSSTIQIDHMDDNQTPSSTVLQFSCLEDSQTWLNLLRSSACAARELFPEPIIMQRTLTYIARKLEVERDYSPDCFQAYRIVQRAGKTSYRSSSDDLQKMYSTVCYLAIGLHKVHLIPLPKAPASRSTGTLAHLGSSGSYGVMNLTHLYMSRSDDSFCLAFRFPCQTENRLLLASTHSTEIIQSIRRLCDFLRPCWLIAPFKVDIPKELRDEPLAADEPCAEEDYNFIDRTMTAYCAAYDLDASNLCYSINKDAEDSPQFILHPPAHPRRKSYSDLELLAVLRSLRWNEAFASLSFRGISLDPLTKIYEKHGTEYEQKATRSARPIRLKNSEESRPILVSELRALALCSTKLRSMDFYETVHNKKRRNSLDIQNDESEGCGIVEAMMPLCRREYINVDWFNFGGIELTESDLDWLVDAAASRLAHFRGFELSRCGLTERMVNLFLAALVAHENTLEVLDLSGNPGRFHAPSLNNAMCYFPYLRKLNLSRLLRTSGPDPLLTAEVLLKWRLQELDLSETVLNAQSIDAISTYLASPQSDSLHKLVATQTGITAHDAAVFMHTMHREPGKPRDMHLYIGQNPLNINYRELMDAIAMGITPSHLTMRMVDYPKEEMFRELIKALTVNKTLEFVDLSKASLPYEAGAETCAALGELFSKNKTLRELDLSGEQAVLETSRLGPGINAALGRLAENSTLEALRIELQTLGNSGAIVLSQVLRQNSTLRRLYCDMNKIHLQGFSAVVNTLEFNTTLIDFPLMEKDRAEQIKTSKKSINHQSESNTSQDRSSQPRSVLKKDGSLRKAKMERRVSILDHGRSRFKPSLGRQLSTTGETPSNTSTVVTGINSPSEPSDLIKTLEEKWDEETVRLLGYLERNNILASQT